MPVHLALKSHQPNRRGFYRSQNTFLHNSCFSLAVCNYLTMEREAMGLIYSGTKFRHYLLSYKFVFHVNHATLLYIATKSLLTDKIVRWYIDLGPSMQLIVSQFSSRDTTAILDDLPNFTLLHIEMTSLEPDDPNHGCTTWSIT
jgi:hypothetical protein